jgi:hypothetical protein
MQRELMLISHHQNAGQNHDIKMANVAKFKYLGMTVSQNCIMKKSACCLLHADIWLGLLFNPKDGKMEATCSSEISVDFHLTKWRYTIEDRINQLLPNHKCSAKSLYLQFYYIQGRTNSSVVCPGI